MKVPLKPVPPPRAASPGPSTPPRAATPTIPAELSFEPLDGAADALAASASAVAASRALVLAQSALGLPQTPSEVDLCAAELERAVTARFLEAAAHKVAHLTTAMDRVAMEAALAVEEGRVRDVVDDLVDALGEVRALPDLFREHDRVLGTAGGQDGSDLWQCLEQLHLVAVDTLDAVAEELRKVLTRQVRPADAGRRRPSAPVETQGAITCVAVFLPAQRPWRERMRRPLGMPEVVGLLADGYSRRLGRRHFDDGAMSGLVESFMPLVLAAGEAEEEGDSGAARLDPRGASFSVERGYWPPVGSLREVFSRRVQERLATSWNPIELASTTLVPREEEEEEEEEGGLEHLKHEWAGLYAQLVAALRAPPVAAAPGPLPTFGSGGVARSEAARLCTAALQAALDAVALDAALAGALAANAAAAYAHWAAALTTKHEVATRTPELLRTLSALPGDLSAVAEALLAVNEAAAQSRASAQDSAHSRPLPDLAAGVRLEYGLRFLAETETEILVERCEQTVASICDSTIDAAELNDPAARGQPAFLRSTLESVLDCVRDHVLPSGAEAARAVLPRVFDACVNALGDALLRAQPQLTAEGAQRLAGQCGALRDWAVAVERPLGAGAALSGAGGLQRLHYALDVLTMPTNLPSTALHHEAQSALPDFGAWLRLKPAGPRPGASGKVAPL